ncbi:hypothetical protein BDV97DRAFT_388384 [Delphinella strobiligena]|nr:hypothetical protein BDV97DRAFT_388384 [Delphinella strobiligena]
MRTGSSLKVFDMIDFSIDTVSAVPSSHDWNKFGGRICQKKKTKISQRMAAARCDVNRFIPTVTSQGLSSFQRPEETLFLLRAIYDRIGEPLQRWLENLTARFNGQLFHDIAATNPEAQVHEKTRGPPDNVGSLLVADHPIVGGFPEQINGLSKAESDGLLKFSKDLLINNHDFQV